MVDSVAANNGLLGFGAASDTSNSTTNVTLTHSLAEGNGTGVEAVGVNATLWLAQSTVTGNADGFNASSSGVIDTFQDNSFANNGANTGSLTPVSQRSPGVGPTDESAPRRCPLSALFGPDAVSPRIRCGMQ